MNDTNWIDSCQAHFPVQYTSNMELFSISDTEIVFDSDRHLSRTCKTSFLFAPMAVCVQAGYSAFPFFTP